MNRQQNDYYNHKKKISLREFTSNPSEPLFIQFGKHDESMILHSHADFSELVIILEGTATHIVGEEEYPIQKGDVFVIHSDTLHGYQNAKDFRICNLMFHFDDIFPRSCDLWNIPGFHALFVIEPTITKERSFQSRLKLSFPETDLLKSRLFEMLQEYDAKKEGYQTFLQASFLSIALLLARKYNMNPSSEKENYVHMANAISFMEKNYIEDISVTRMAQQANLSSRHFSRLFQEIYHDSPGNYLLQFRLEKSKQLLMQSNNTITQIADQCGFRDSNYFSRQFFKKNGISPRDFRKQLRSFHD